MNSRVCRFEKHLSISHCYVNSWGIGVDGVTDNHTKSRRYSGAVSRNGLAVFLLCKCSSYNEHRGGKIPLDRKGRGGKIRTA